MIKLFKTPTLFTPTLFRTDTKKLSHFKLHKLKRQENFPLLQLRKYAREKNKNPPRKYIELVHKNIR